MTTELPDIQRQLLDEIMSKLGQINEPETLLRFMAQVLKTLLRRQGDVQFLAVIQDAFAAGLPGLTFAEQKELAAEVIQVVILKRPEIAQAWRAANGIAEPSPAVPHRRAIDQPMPLPPPLPLEAEPERYDFAAAEVFVAGQIASVLDRRLSVLRVAPPSIPSMAFCFAQPFFLFAPRFADIAKAFMTGPVLSRCRMGLEKRVYSRIDHAVLTEPDRQKEFWAEAREVVWKVMDARLSKLAAHHKSAEAKQQAAARKGNQGEAGFKIVEMPVTKPRTYNILGVEFALGKVTTTKRVKVKTPPPYKLEPEEQEALELMEDLRRGASQLGIDLPAAADFQFLRTLMEFNTRLFIQIRDELLGLAGHEETSSQFLAERFKAADKSFTNHLTDVLAMMMFTRHGDDRFGLKDFYAVCVGSARDKSAMVAKRPFIPGELARRPHELAVQLREALRRRLHVDAVLGSVERLLDCYKIMGKNLFGQELEEAKAVISTFPMVFAGDPEAPVFAMIAKLVLANLSGELPDRSICLMRVGQAYDRIGRKSAATA